MKAVPAVRTVKKKAVEILPTSLELTQQDVRALLVSLSISRLRIGSFRDQHNASWTSLTERLHLMLPAATRYDLW